MPNTNTIPISFKTSAYGILKHLNATILGVFCEFIDNSIQSYLNDKIKIHQIDPNFKLKIKITYDGDEIVIRDNAGGIDANNFDRALKPGGKALNTEGLNEFGLGMKYAAVWVSNEWQLTSSAIGETVERSVIFNYKKVTEQELEVLPYGERPVEVNSHYTEVRLRQLEKKHVYPWQKDYIKRKIAYIYRNFLREKTDFHNEWVEENIELDVLGEKLIWEEYGFLNKPWYEDILNDIKSNNIEWKYKFPWFNYPVEENIFSDDGSLIRTQKRNIEVSGFVGILPDGNHKGKNGFVLLRRGRVVEGVDNRIYPIHISGKSARAFKYIRLYGEIHFRGADISFDKSKILINNEIRNKIFDAISGYLKNIEFESKHYDLILQADKHRVAAKTKSQLIKDELPVPDTTPTVILPKVSSPNDDEDTNSGLPSFHNYSKNYNIGSKVTKYETLINKGSIHDKLYTYSTHESKGVTINVNSEHPVFNYIVKENNLEFFINFLNCLVAAEIQSKAGRNDPRDIKNYLNNHLSQFINI